MNERITIISEIKSIIANDDTLFYAISGIILLLLALCILFGFRWRKACKQYKNLQKETKALKQFNDELNHYAGQLTEAKKLETKIRCLKQDTELAEIAFETLRNNAVCELEKVRNTKEEYTATVNRKEILEAELRQLDSQLNEKQSEIQEQKKLRDTLENAIKESGITLHQLNAAKAELIKQIRPLISTYKKENTGAKNKTTIAIKRIGYNPNNQFRNDRYPAVYWPKANSVLKKPRNINRIIKGLTEDNFNSHLTKHFNSSHKRIHSDKCLVVKEHVPAFEPDFCYVEENLNLYIDIEIDEPYYYKNDVGCPTHFIGEDDHRNRYFNDCGWIVIRFSEKQIHQSPESCCKFIAEVINSLNDSINISEEFNGISDVDVEAFWTAEKAEEWIKNRERENYTGHIIRSINNENTSYIPSEQTPDEIKADRVIKEEKEQLNVRGNDNQIADYLKKKGIINSSQYATTALTKENQASINQGRTDKTDVGNGITKFIEIINLSNSLSFDKYEKDIEISNTEINYNEKINIKSKNKDNSYSIFKWDFEDDDTNTEFNIAHRAIQMNIIKRIFETNEKEKISKMYFFLFDTRLKKYQLYKAHELPEITTDILYNTKQQKSN